MKTKILTITLCILTFLSSCEKDETLFKVSGLKSSVLASDNSDVVLTQETASSNVLTLTWDESALTTSDTSMKLPTWKPELVIELSATSDFDSVIVITPASNSFTFTGSVLNIYGGKLNFAIGASTPMYFRIRAAYGANTESFYSNVLTVNVTCFKVDMFGVILDRNQVNTGFKLYAPNNDGEYIGFTGASAWYNWFLQEGDGTIWGNLNVDGNAFVLSKEDSHWNFWYPGQTGCYYTTLSTKNEAWSATLMPTLNITGDVTADMTFDRANVKWYASITTTADNAKIKVSCSDVKLYSKETGTDDAAAIAKTIGFVPHSDSTLTFEWNNASAGDITISKAGDYTLTFYLSDPKKWTFQLKAGKTVVTKPLSKKLYLMGIDDGISGSWTFNNYLTLVSEDDSTYAGVVNVNSLWGYQMALDSGEWTNVYKMGSTEGTLLYKGGSNITAPAAGLYLIQVDLKNKTYSHTAVSSLSHAGLNDNWTMAAMTATSVAGVYSAAVTISAVSQWGCKLYFNGGWDLFYGGKDGVLAFKGNGIIDDATIGAGSYDLIVNTRNDASYVFLGDKVYIGGLNDAWDFTSVVLSKTSTGVYTGTATITTTSTYGIKIYLTAQNWDRFYGGSFSKITYLGSNIKDDQALSAGTYTVTVDFINNTCSFVK
jgi:hypothetical protein